MNHINGQNETNAQPPDRNPPLRLFRKFALAMLLLILVFSVFANTLTNGFVFDDTSMIKNNAAVRSALYIKYYFTRPFFSVGQPIGGPVAYDYYRPMVLVSYYVDHLLWDGAPAGYHLTNIFLQSLAAIMLFLTLNKLRMSAHASFFAALFFAVHPALADSVAGVSGRSDPLCAVFLLTAAYLYLVLRQSAGRSRRWLLSAYSSAFACALLTKENAIAFPLLLTAYELIGPDLQKPDRLVNKLNNALPGYAVSIIYIFWRAHIIPGSLGLPADMEIAKRAATAVVAAADYLLISVFPHNLYFETFVPQVETISSLKVIVSTIALSALMGTGIALKKRSPHITFFVCWFFIFLLPFSYFFLFHSEPLFFTPPHFLYFPAMGLAAAGAYVLECVWSRHAPAKWKSRTIVACAAMVFLLFAMQTMRRNALWHDEFKFFSNMAQRRPLNPRTYIGLASIFLERSQPGYALAQYAKALSLANRTPSPQAATPGETGGGEIKGIKGTLVIADPYAAAACAGMGDAYLALGEMPAAIEYYQKAASENAFDAAVHFRLARAYEVVGNFEKALAGYDRALRLNKSMADAKASRKIALMKSEVYEQAKRVYLTSHLSGQEGSADAYYGEGVMLRLSGRRIAAEALFRKAAGQAPMHFGANLALGQILSEKGMHEEAFANFSAAFASQPTSAVAARELALTSLILKDTAGAVQWAAKSYELAPETYYEQFRDDVIRLAEPAQ